MKTVTRKLCLSLAFLLSLAGADSLPPARAGVPVLAGVGNPPPATSAAIFNWKAAAELFAESQVSPARANNVYCDPAAGLDSNDGLTAATPKLTLHAAEALFNAQPNTALHIKRGTVCHQTYPYVFGVTVGAVQSGSSNTLSVDTLATQSVAYPGQSVTLTTSTGATQVMTLSSTLSGAGAGVAGAGANTTYVFTATIPAATYVSLTATLLAGIDAQQPHQTVDAYGQGPSPILSGFNVNWNSNNFKPSTDASRADAYVNTWSIADANASPPLVLVREVNNVKTVYRHLLTGQGASAAQVDMFPGTVWKDGAGGKVYLHPWDESMLSGSPPAVGSGRQYEGAVANNCNAIYLGGATASYDDQAVIGIRQDGYGAGGSLPAYGLKGTCQGTDCHLWLGDESYFGANHCLADLAGTWGGNVLIKNCLADYGSCDLAPGGVSPDTPFVTYAAGGGQTDILVNDECRAPVMPVGVQPPENFSTFIGHSAYVTFGTYASGATALPITGSAATWPYVNVLAGDQFSFVGGTAETTPTYTITAYNTATGILTLDHAITNTNHTGIARVGGQFAGGGIESSPALSLVDNCRIPAGPWQSAAPFGGVGNAPEWTDLAGCRSFVFNDVLRMRLPSVLDEQPVTVALTSASQVSATTASVTITTPLLGIAGAATASMGPQPSGYVTLSGGSALPERIRVLAYTPATGVTTFQTAIAGAGRTAMTYTVPARTATIIPCPFPARTTSAYTAFINCDWEGVTTDKYLSGASGNTTVFFPGATTVLLNCRAVLDYTHSDNPVGPGHRGFWSVGTGSAVGGPYLYNCLLSVKTEGRDYPTWDANTSQLGQVNPAHIFNSVFDMEGVGSTTSALGAAYVGLGNVAANQADNAYVATQVSGVGGYDQDPYAVPVSDYLAGFAGLASPLLSASNQLVQVGSGDTPRRLEYDAKGQARSTALPAIGTAEPVTVPRLPAGKGASRAR